MLRLRGFRPLGALLAIIYIALPGGAFGVRACAHHDSAVPEARDGAPAVEQHAHHGAHGGGADADGEDSAPHGGCSCLDTCAASAAIAMPGAAVAIDAATTASPAALYAPVDAPRTPLPDHFLPYPHGPPVVPV